MPDDSQLSLANPPYAGLAGLPFPCFSPQSGYGITGKEIQGLLTKRQKPGGRELTSSPPSVSVLADRPLEKILKMPRNW